MSKRSSGMTYIPESVNTSQDYNKHIRNSVNLKEENMHTNAKRPQSPERLTNPDKYIFLSPPDRFSREG